MVTKKQDNSFEGFLICKDRSKQPYSYSEIRRRLNKELDPSLKIATKANGRDTEIVLIDKVEEVRRWA
jgi:hypothetical protein